MIQYMQISFASGELMRFSVISLITQNALLYTVLVPVYVNELSIDIGVCHDDDIK